MIKIDFEYSLSQNILIHLHFLSLLIGPLVLYSVVAPNNHNKNIFDISTLYKGYNAIHLGTVAVSKILKYKT